MHQTKYCIRQFSTFLDLVSVSFAPIFLFDLLCYPKIFELPWSVSTLRQDRKEEQQETDYVINPTGVYETINLSQAGFAWMISIARGNFKCACLGVDRSTNAYWRKGWKKKRVNGQQRYYVSQPTSSSGIYSPETQRLLTGTWQNKEESIHISYSNMSDCF